MAPVRDTHASQLSEKRMNRVDYNKAMKEIAAEGRLLLHVCCAPCSSSVLRRLVGYEIIPYYYNPNIDTEEEFLLRAAQFEKLDVTPEIVPYAHDEFLRAVRGHENDAEGGERCRACIALRLERTAQRAAQEGIGMFCSTLSVSPHKDADFINRTGETLAKKYGVKFLPNDFKKENGFLQSVQLSKEAGLYRQAYCGCEFAKNNGGEIRNDGTQ